MVFVLPNDAMQVLVSQMSDPGKGTPLCLCAATVLLPGEAGVGSQRLSSLVKSIFTFHLTVATETLRRMMMGI